MKERPVGYFDGDIYPEFRSVSVSLLFYLRPELTTLKVQRELFLSEEIRNPNFRYDRLNEININNRKHQLETLKESLLKRRAATPLVVTLYRRIIQQELRKLDLLSVLKIILDNPSNDEAGDLYRRLVCTLYGSPICSLFFQTIEVLSIKIANSNPGIFNEVDYRSSRDRLETLVKSYHDSSSKCPLVLSRRPDIPVVTDRLITDENELWGMFYKAIKDLSLDGWQVEVDKTGLRSNFSVSLNKRLLKAPSFNNLSLRSREKAITLSMVRGLIAHELETHALRYERGLRSPLQLLATGLDLYEQGAEGLATYREQRHTGAQDYAGFSYYLAAGLATGVGGAERDFREVFEIMVDYYVVNDQVGRVRACELAWEVTLRVFRGTPGNMRGLVYTKDVIYREGNTLAWEFFPYFENLPEEQFNIGKYDPTNREHVRVLTELELISASLAEAHSRICLPHRSELLLCYPEQTSNIVKT